MSITDLIMVFEVHIKMQVHSISYQTKLKPMCWCTLQITNMHIACTKHTITLYICMCALQEKKHVLTKISLSQWLFIGKVVSLKFLSWLGRGVTD